MDSKSPIVSLASDTQSRVLLQRIQDGDTNALGELVETCHRALGVIAFAILGSDDLAQDAVQDVFIKLWQQRHELAVHTNLRTYLRRAVRNRALDIARANRRANQRDEQWWDGWATSADVYNTGETAYDAQAFRQMVYRALEGLPPRSREIFLMHWEAELAYGEIAELLGIGLPTIYNQMSRATAHVAAYFKARGWP